MYFIRFYTEIYLFSVQDFAIIVILRHFLSMYDTTSLFFSSNSDF